MPLNAVKIADLQAHKVGGGVWHAAGVHNNSQDSTLAQNHPWNVKKERKKKVTNSPLSWRKELVDRLFSGPYFRFTMAPVVMLF